MKNRNYLQLMAMLLLALGLQATVKAEQQIQRMTIYSEVAGADEILAGKFELAIKKMLLSPSGNPLLRYNNLCVAYTLNRQLERAKTTCKRALRESKRRQNYGETWLEQTKTPRLRRLYKSRAETHLQVLESVKNQLVMK